MSEELPGVALEGDGHLWSAWVHNSRVRHRERRRMALSDLCAIVAALPDEMRRKIPELRVLAELCDLLTPFVAEPGCAEGGEGLVGCLARKLSALAAATSREGKALEVVESCIEYQQEKPMQCKFCLIRDYEGNGGELHDDECLLVTTGFLDRAGNRLEDK